MTESKKWKAAKDAESFLRKEHSDTNMLVAIWIWPLSEKEISNWEMDILSVEDKLLIVLDRV